MAAATRKKSDRMAWFRQDAGAFLGDTMGLPLLHIGVYAKLQALYWASGNRLPEDPLVLKRKMSIHTNEEEEALLAVLNEFFPGGCNASLDDYLEEVNANSKMQSDKAKLRYVKESSGSAPKSPGDAGVRDF